MFALTWSDNIPSPVPNVSRQLMMMMIRFWAEKRHRPTKKNCLATGQCKSTFKSIWYLWGRVLHMVFGIGILQFSLKVVWNICVLSIHPKWRQGLVDILNEKLKIFFSTSTPKTFSQNKFDSTRQIRQTSQITNNRFWLERHIGNMFFFFKGKKIRNWFEFKERIPWNILYFQFDRRAKFLTQNLVIRQTFILDLQSRNLGRADLCPEIQIELGSHRRHGGKKVKISPIQIVL